MTWPGAWDADIFAVLLRLSQEQGITAQRGLPRNVYARMPDSNVSTPVPGSTVGSDAGTPDNDSDAPVASTSASASASAATSVAPSAVGSKRGGAKLTAAQLKKQKMAAAAEAGVEFNIGGSNVAAPGKGRYDDRKMPGSITQCAECGKKFTVSKVSAPVPSTRRINSILTLPSATVVHILEPPRPGGPLRPLLERDRRRHRRRHHA